MKVKTLTYSIFCTFFMFCLFFSSASCETGHLRIIHINDFHGSVTGQKLLGSDTVQGGVEHLAGLSDTLKKEQPTLLLAAGDMIQGNTFANLSHGRPIIEIMNAMGFDALVVGNHEFDFGQKVLKELIHEANFPVLGANVTGFPELKPYTIREIGGLKVAIIGVVTEDTPTATHPPNVAGLNFLSVSGTVDKYVRELRSKVDIIIVLSHIGFNADMDLANKVKGIDLIVGGHSHTKTERHLMVGQTIIVQAWEHGLVLGVLDLTLQDKKIIAVSSRLEEIKPSAAKKKNDIVESIVAKYASQMKAMMGKVVGETESDLDGEGKHVRTRETNLGDLIAHIVKSESGADAAIINGGGIRTSIRKGAITVNDVYSVLPFDNYIVAMELSGKQLKDALEYGVSAVEQAEGRFPQVSGIAFTYWPKRKSGSRIESITVNREPLDLNRKYTVATSDFLAAGGDGYQVFRDAIKESPDFAVAGGIMKGSRIVYNDAGRWLRDVVVRYISREKRISFHVDGRIKEMQ